MKKNIYYSLISILVAAAIFIVATRWKETRTTAYFPMLERKGEQAQLEEWTNTRNLGEKLIRIVRDDPGDIKNRIALATVYINEARVTGEYSYYDAAALTYIDEVLKKDPSHFEALTLKAMLLLSQHHFADGLEIAKKAQSQNPYNAFVYGLLTDAQVELGNYGEAIKMAERMVSIRPDIRSYSRISYIREIHGDYDGAIEAMKMAVKAGGYGDEATEWSRVQLAKLYENTGDLENAKMHYSIALNERPGYAYALAGLARLATAEKEYKKAIGLYERANSLVKDHSFKEELAKLYKLTGEQKKGERILSELISQMKEESKEIAGSANAGHHADLELATAYLLNNDPDKALKYALSEYKQRTGNIDVNEVVGWVYYKKGEADKAIPYIDAALRTGSRNSRLLCRSGLIYAKIGQGVKAKQILEEGLKFNAVMDLELQSESKYALKNLLQQTR